MITTVYQFFVCGGSLAGWKIQHYSKKVFRTRDGAEAYMPAFIELVANPKEIDALNKDDIHDRGIAKLELIDE